MFYSGLCPTLPHLVLGNGAIYGGGRVAVGPWTESDCVTRVLYCVKNGAHNTCCITSHFVPGVSRIA